MKRIFLMMALAVTALFATTACGGDDEDDKGGSGSNNGAEVVLTPPFKSEAIVLNLAKNDNNIKQIRIMPSGSYMIEMEAVLGARQTRADGPDDYFTFGKFTYSDGVFKFDNGMSISLGEKSGNGVDVTITWQNGTTLKTTGTIDTSDTVAPGVMTDNLCSRGWTINKVRVIGTAGGVKLAKDFPGPVDLAKMKEWYESNFGTLKDQFNANTIIEGIYFDAYGLFAIKYRNRKDDVGVWRWKSMTDGTLVYSWNDKLNAISLFTGSASAVFKDASTLELTLNGSVDGHDLEFQFTLK